MKPSTKQYPNIGTGVHDLTYYSTEVVFKNAFLQADPFWNQLDANHWPDGQRNLRIGAVGPNGMPLGDPAVGWWRTHMRKGLPVYEGGRYFIITDAIATFTFYGDANGTHKTTGNPSTPVTFWVTPSKEGFSMIIRNIEKAPTYIHIVHEGYLSDFLDKPFHPLFLRNLGHYSCIRFMDACGAFSKFGDGEPGRRWENRTTKFQPQNRALNEPYELAFTHNGYDRKWANNYGMCYDYIYELCNELDTDCYICIPPLATTEFALKMIRLIRKGLKPHLKLYYEWSNEVWNLNFPQSGAFAILADNSTEVNFPYNKFWFTKGNSNVPVTNLLSLTWQAHRMKEVTTEVMKEFTRFDVHPVFAFQTANAWNADQVLQINDYHKTFTHLACNGYFGHFDELLPYPWGGTPAQWKNYLSGTIINLRDELVRVKTVADKYSLATIAYEAGQHVICKNAAQVNEWGRIQETQVLYDLYCELIDMWFSVFGNDSVFLHYYNTGSWGSYGSWGAQRDLLDFWSPKFRALQDKSSHSRGGL